MLTWNARAQEAGMEMNQCAGSRLELRVQVLPFVLHSAELPLPNGLRSRAAADGTRIIITRVIASPKLDLSEKSPLNSGLRLTLVGAAHHPRGESKESA